MTEFGYIRIISASPEVRIADIEFNSAKIKNQMTDASEMGAEILVMPELCLTGYTCGDIFEQELIYIKIDEAIKGIAEHSKNLDLMTVIGGPVIFEGKRYNCAIAIANGEILGIVPKINIPNYSEFYEKRWFSSGKGIRNQSVILAGKSIPFGVDIIFQYSGVKIGIEICEDLWVPQPPSIGLCLNGADVILNLSATDENIGKHDYLTGLIKRLSASCRCVYAYASAGWGESSTDLVFSGNQIIAYDGKIKSENERFQIGSSFVMADVDVSRLRHDRTKYNSFYNSQNEYPPYRIVKGFLSKPKEIQDIKIDEPEMPFVPVSETTLNRHCKEIFSIQSYGLMKRLDAINCKKCVIGISGGLDSTLALLVTIQAFDQLGIDRKGIVGVTMPGEATTGRTKWNALKLMEELGVTSYEIPIGQSVNQHLKDINHPNELYDVTYENAQARERTQILMDLANKENGIVIGTGDMSELALGWCTYNGDHMSMYGVNSSVPKTLVKHLVGWFAASSDKEVKELLYDIIDTPISPELIPSKTEEISQKTEEIVGPYKLHDFFLYHVLRNSFSPKKIYWLACNVFKDSYTKKEIKKWLYNFYRRFFNQQFKRSCMPDGPKVGSVSLSPRGDWRMPSDASSAIWLREVENLNDE